MGKKLRVAILFGGKSAEHEVSLSSAKNVLDALNRDKYDVFLIGIDPSGHWHLQQQTEFLLAPPEKLDIGPNQILLSPGDQETHLIHLSDQRQMENLDVVFPILHGPNGEDGTVQGFLELADLPFVGSDVLGSAIGMDKDVMKRLFRDADIPTARFMVFSDRQQSEIAYSTIQKELGAPFFVKPSTLGSSVGISKVNTETELAQAVDNAFAYDTKIVIEEFIEGREIECAVLGNENPIASKPGEVIPKGEFYSYEAKYIDEDGAQLIVPAELSPGTAEVVQQMAVKAFQVLCCSGMARVDFFLKSSGEVFINEINTIPGFTKISMYPKLWEVSGIGYAELIDRLLLLAIERHQKRKSLKTNVDLS